MSTEIAEIKTEHHERTDSNFSIKWGNDTLHVNRFYGGEQRNTMIQLTIQSGKSYTMLTEEQVKELAQVLNDCFNYDKYPSE